MSDRPETIPDGEERPPADGLDLYRAMGGRRGIADTGLPSLAFVVAYSATAGNLTAAIWTAVAVAVVLTGVRVARGETLQFAIAGLIGVAIAVLVVRATGRAEDFFLPGLLLNAGYAIAWAVSIAIRWPLLGVVVHLLSAAGMDWRKDPYLLRVYSRASWIWVGMFSLRLAVQVPLWLAGEDALLALGIARTTMGVPLFVLAAWLSYLVLRRADALPESLPGGGGSKAPPTGPRPEARDQ